MTVAALRVELEREEAVWGLTMMRRADRWERWETVEPLMREHLPSQTRLRIPLTLMPMWYRQLWWDATQIDGRAEVVDIDQINVRLIGMAPGSISLDTGDTNYTIPTDEFLDAVLAGAVGDSS